MRLVRCLLIGFVCLIAFACAPRQSAEIVERNVLSERQQDEQIGGQFIRIVQPGDTLYSIAFVTGLDVNQIAAWNGIEDTSKLYSGQRIRLTKPIGFKPKPKRNTSKPVVARSSKPAPKTKVTAKSPTKKNGISGGSASKKTPVQSTPKATPKTSPKNSRFNHRDWQWPIRGTLVAHFNPAKGQQGIDIQGQKNQIVKASAAGEVVYAGDSLKGYGHLVILKHSTDYWSAYANNQKIVVAEGDTVEQGQAIARLGTNNKRQAVAQFQIRKNGNPVNPIKYLEP